ncbi:MAG TPA: DUF3226 domain-containing protein [Pirellulaceae bacterium]|nr:DUF3226 domain-containing protein [Pirellulaceae bacterium]
MATAPAPFQIFVEGKNDQHALVHLLTRNQIRYDHPPWPANYPKFQSGLAEADAGDAVSEGAEAILRVMDKVVKTHAGRVVGFVLDADDDPPARWWSIRDRLATVKVDMPHVPSPDGFIGQSQKFKPASESG